MPAEVSNIPAKTETRLVLNPTNRQNTAQMIHFSWTVKPRSCDTSLAFVMISQKKCCAKSSAIFKKAYAQAHTAYVGKIGFLNSLVQQNVPAAYSVRQSASMIGRTGAE